MIEDLLLPYLYRSENNDSKESTEDFLMINSLYKQNLKAKPEMAEWMLKYAKHSEEKFDVNNNCEPLFVCTFANQIIESFAKTELPSFVPYEQLTEQQQSMIYDVKPSFLKVVKIQDEALKPKQIKKLALFGISTALPVICTGAEIALFVKLEVVFEELFHVECWSFKYNFQQHKRNQLHIFDKEYMNLQNKIANELQSSDLGLYAFLFNQKIRADFVAKLEHLDDLELAIHDSEITDNVGNLYFHVGYKSSDFKSKFFELLDQDFLASPFFLEQYIDSSSEYKVLDIKHKSQSIMAYMLLHFVVNQCEALEDISKLFQNKSEFNHQNILQKIFSKFEGSVNTHKLLPVT